MKREGELRTNRTPLNLELPSIPACNGVAVDGGMWERRYVV